MATWFGITTTITEQTLPVESRSGQQLYTVTNESGALIRGDGLIVPVAETKVEWFSIVQPSRVYSPDGSEQIPVTIKVPETVAPGVYGYRLRMVVGGGIPEEQFNDGPESRITVQPIPLPPPPPPPPPPPKPFPWWIVVAVIVAIVVIGGIIFFVTRQKSQADLTVSGVGFSSNGDAQVSVTNNGDTASGSFLMYLSYSGYGSNNWPVDSINGHTTTVVYTQVGYFTGGSAGDIYLDTFGQVTESDKSNNEYFFYP
jgi:hypothetical protein